MVSNATRRADRLRHRLPASWGEGGDVVLVGHRREAGEHILEVCERVQTVALAGADDRVDDSRTGTPALLPAAGAFVAVPFAANAPSAPAGRCAARRPGAPWLTPTAPR